MALNVACRGPFLVAKEVLPAMRRAGRGSLLFSNNAQSLRGRKRYTGGSLYYPRVMMRALAQALTEEYSEHGVHVANVVIDGTIDSPGHPGAAPDQAGVPYRSGPDRRRLPLPPPSTPRAGHTSFS
jgi:NAD(P)-dependent dehydrogenase (short-subunit alcohol dehydrogenase family)